MPVRVTMASPRIVCLPNVSATPLSGWPSKRSRKISDQATVKPEFAGRSGDIFTVTEPYYIFDATGTTHGSPYDYDTHVPVIFLGSARIRAGSYTDTIGVEDIAPTLADLLGIAAPSGNMGHVLAQILK